jgi:YidC/Oxa1 family membrane protein insertase
LPIEQIRLFLFVGLLFVGFLLWQAWEQEYASTPVPSASSASTEAGGGVDVPELPAVASAAPSAPSESEIQGDRVRVRTDVVAAEIDTVGGTLRRLDLLDYPIAPEKPDAPFELLSDAPPDVFLAQSGLLSASAAPNHHTRFTVENAEYVLPDGADSLDVRLGWTSPDGVQFAKVYTFHRDSYLIELRHEVANASSVPWVGRIYGQLQRAEVQRSGGFGFIYTYTGGVLSSEEDPYEKIDFSDMASQNVERSVEGGWAAMIQHYFAAAWIPPPEGVNYFYTKALGSNLYVIGVMSSETSIEAGQSGELAMKLFAGPKIQQRMEAAAPRLKLTVDYGWLTIIAEPLFWLLSFIHGIVGNWGWSIIILTILIKLAFFHLSATSYKSMARMRKLQPRLLTLRERYGDDKTKMNQAMMEMYKKEKVNPLGGCLPIVVQIPVFIALYWVLLESVELRQAGFVLWLQDLSAYDPYFVLPILMGVTMLIQQRLNPTPPDPIQAKVMMALPFVFTFFFLFFPSGLVLYWFVNNLLSIAQQWVITRRIAPGT